MAAAREYAITYNGLTIPSTIGTTKATIHGVQRLTKSSTDFEFVFQVYLYDSPSAAAMAADVKTLEDTFRQPLGDLDVVLTSIVGSDTGNILDLDFSNNEALNTEASIQKVGSEADSARSRLYEVTITGELPYTVASPATGQIGLREFSYDLEFSASRRAQLTMNGEYTVQSGGAGAAALYIVQVLLLYDQIISDLGFGNWPTSSQPASETRSPDKNDQVISFTRVYKELVASEKIGAIDDADVLDQRLTVTRITKDNESDPDSRITEAPQELSATYEANIDQTRTKDLKGLWESTLRPWVIQNVRNTTNSGGPLRLISENLTLDPVENVVLADLQFEVFTGLRFVSLTVDITTEMEAGHIISKVWPTTPTRSRKDLLPTQGYVFDGARTIKQTVVTTRTTRGQSFPIDLFTGGSIGSTVGTVEKGGTGLLVVISRTSANKRRRIGNSQIGETVDLLDEIRTEVIELVGKVV